MLLENPVCPLIVFVRKVFSSLLQSNPNVVFGIKILRLVFKGYQMEDIFVHLSLINDPMHRSVFPFSFDKIRAIHDASPGSDCLPPATL